MTEESEPIQDQLNSLRLALKAVHREIDYLRQRIDTVESLMKGVRGAK